MAKTIMLVPIQPGVGLVSCAMGFVRAMEQRGVAFDFFNPIETKDDNQRENKLIHPGQNIISGLSFHDVEKRLSDGELSSVLEDISAKAHQLNKNANTIIIKGLSPNPKYPYIERLNAALAKTFNAYVVFIAMPGDDINQLNKQLEITAQAYGGIDHDNVYGCIVNKIHAPLDDEGHARLDITHSEQHQTAEDTLKKIQNLPLFKKNKLQLMGCIFWDKKLYAPRICDIIEHLNAEIITPGNIKTRRVHRIKLCARTINNVLYVLKHNSLIITAGDRADILLAAALAELQGIKISALILTGKLSISDDVMQFCQPAFAKGLSVLSVKTDSFETANLLKHLDTTIPLSDHERIELVRDSIAEKIDCSELISDLASNSDLYITPPAFCYRLLEKAKKSNRRIVLPEGDEIRTIQAANECVTQGIAQCVLLANPDSVSQMAENHNIILHDKLEIIDPDSIRDQYIAPLCEYRKHKGMTEAIAIEQLKDNVMLGTLMLQQGDVDGLVSGAIHTTANTIRPALQIVKTREDVSKVSSLFFMCLPEKVLAFADCAVNPDPDSNELADIAIQTADTAMQFDIIPRIAMLSYSTGNSGQGTDVDKVKEAVALIKKQRPDLIIDGPLQYDAAVIESVGKQKAPDSPTAGKASVLIFPDLNSGNTTYKAVQRSANIICIGPVLLGLKKTRQ